MSSDEFWKDDPQLFVSYRTSFINKKNREAEELDYKCWLQGLYFHTGNRTLFESLKQFIGNLVATIFKGTKNTTKIDTYPKEPYTILAKNKQKKIEKKDNYKEYHDSLIYHGSIKQIYLQKLKNKSKGE